MNPCRDCVALVEVRAENERLKVFIAGCVKLGGEQSAKLLAVAAAFNGWANGCDSPAEALEAVGRALGEPF